jgi:hypothetical protein
MSKFDDLCQAYATSRKAYVEYRDASFGFSQTLLEALVRYLEVPDGRIRLVPVNREPDADAVYPLGGAMHLDEDTYWHLGVLIDLSDPAGAYPPQAVLIKLLLKRCEATFCVRLGQEGDDFVVRDGYPQDLAAFLDHVHGTIKESYEQGLQQFLEQQESTRKIGFAD